jgi:hypothetical protein
MLWSLQLSSIVGQEIMERLDKELIYYAPTFDTLLYDDTVVVAQFQIRGNALIEQKAYHLQAWDRLCCIWPAPIHFVWLCEVSEVTLFPRSLSHKSDNAAIRPQSRAQIN